MTTTHPQLAPGEKFLGNIEGDIPDHLKHISGIRYVRPALDIYGLKLGSEYSAMLATAEAAAEYRKSAAVAAFRKADGCKDIVLRND